jgi:hypothetical protein
MAEKTHSHGEQIDTISNSSPPSSDAEKHVAFDEAVDENQFSQGYFASKFFVGSMAGVAAYFYVGVIDADIEPVRKVNRLQRSNNMANWTRIQTSLGSPFRIRSHPPSRSPSSDAYRTSLDADGFLWVVLHSVSSAALSAQPLRASMHSSVVPLL